jgi:hypothetical protein
MGPCARSRFSSASLQSPPPAVRSAAAPRTARPPALPAVPRRAGDGERRSSRRQTGAGVIRRRSFSSPARASCSRDGPARRGEEAAGDPQAAPVRGLRSRARRLQLRLGRRQPAVADGVAKSGVVGGVEVGVGGRERRHRTIEGISLPEFRGDREIRSPDRACALASAAPHQGTKIARPRRPVRGPPAVELKDG